MMRMFLPITATIVALSWLPIPSDTLSPVGKAEAQSQAEVAQRIREIQKALKYFGFYRGRIDGEMGPGTIAALNRFSEEARSKGLIKTTGPITAQHIEVLFSQYERSVEKKNKAQSRSAEAQSDTKASKAGSPSGSVAVAEKADSKSETAALPRPAVAVDSSATVAASDGGGKVTGFSAGASQAGAASASGVAVTGSAAAVSAAGVSASGFGGSAAASGAGVPASD